MINEERLSKALRYLAETDEECARLKTNMERFEFKAKAVKDAIFMRLEGSVADRNAQAGASDDYNDAMETYFGALHEHEAMRNKRSTESIVVDVWRSLNSSRNKGNL
jgi:hypothetical protein